MIDALVHVLYDMAARIEDVIGLTAADLQASLGKGMALKQKKAPSRRLVFLSDDTLERI
jgi:site-specific recombinase XerD